MSSHNARTRLLYITASEGGEAASPAACGVTAGEADDGVGEVMFLVPKDRRDYGSNIAPPIPGAPPEGAIMELVHEMTYHAMLRPPMPIGDGPFGSRMFFDVTGGELEGPRVRGKFVGGGGDWLLAGPDGFGRLDVRAQIETDDGAFLYLQYFGLIEMNDKVQAAMGSAQETAFEEQYFRTSPRFETGDARYAWLNTSLFIGEGRMFPGLGVEYRVYRVT